jgi:hypothetical protein
MAALSIWSMVHGLTMLVIDNRAGLDITVDHLTERAIRLLLDGLGAEQTR